MVDKWLGDHQERQGLLARLGTQKNKKHVKRKQLEIVYSCIVEK